MRAARHATPLYYLLILVVSRQWSGWHAAGRVVGWSVRVTFVGSHDHV
jgi:hypothetical protein